MNLIEQLGGYEQAEALRVLPAATYDCGIKFTREELDSALLEYRRQHNIFEVGDKVVEITDYPSNDVLTVKSLSDKLLVCESDDFSASYVLSDEYKPCFYVGHADDAEIEARCRL